MKGVWILYQFVRIFYWLLELFRQLNYLLLQFAPLLFCNIVSYSKLQPTKYHIYHSDFAPIFAFLPSIPGTGNSAHTYKTCQHQHKNVGYVHFFHSFLLVIVLVILDCSMVEKKDLSFL